MCGTLMQIVGQGAALYILDLLVRPAFGGGLMVDMFLFLVKGFATFWIYKWFQCSTNGIIRNPLHGTSFWMALIGGIVGMFTLMLTGMVLNEQREEGGIEILMKYGIEAVILNIVYGMGHNIIQDVAVNSFRHH